VGLLLGIGIGIAVSPGESLSTSVPRTDLAPKVVRQLDLEGNPKLMNAVFGLTLRLLSVANVLHLAGSITLTVASSFFCVVSGRTPLHSQSLLLSLPCTWPFLR